MKLINEPSNSLRTMSVNRSIDFNQKIWEIYPSFFPADKDYQHKVMADDDILSRLGINWTDPYNIKFIHPPSKLEWINFDGTFIKNRYESPVHFRIKMAKMISDINLRKTAFQTIRGPYNSNSCISILFRYYPTEFKLEFWFLPIDNINGGIEL